MSPMRTCDAQRDTGNCGSCAAKKVRISVSVHRGKLLHDCVDDSAFARRGVTDPLTDLEFVLTHGNVAAQIASQFTRSPPGQRKSGLASKGP
jgi:hypothetical protein